MNIPKVIIERALAKGNDKNTKDLISSLYEGFGPGGVGLLIEVLTDSKNRTAGSLRSILSKSGGKLDKQGSVLWMFDNKPLIKVFCIDN